MFKQLREDIACILERDPAARSHFEILTCYPGLHAILVHRLANFLWRHRWYWAGRFVSHLGRIFTGIEIHPGARIGKRVFIDHGFGVVIGETAEIGDDCTIYQGVTLGGTRLYKGEKRHPTLEEGVIVGAGAQILGGFTVGAHARVGSNAVVIKPVPPGATAVGNPARVILPAEEPPVSGGPDSEADAADSADHLAAAMPEHDREHATGTKKWDAKTPGAEPAGTAPPQEPDWSAKPLQALLQRRRSATEEDAAAFTPYGIGQGDSDPLVQVLHELIDHVAQQDERIHRLCKALEDLGQRIDNGEDPLDADRLNRMVE